MGGGDSRGPAGDAAHGAAPAAGRAAGAAAGVAAAREEGRGTDCADAPEAKPGLAVLKADKLARTDASFALSSDPRHTASAPEPPPEPPPR
jgi:hypothetical protein